MQLSDDAIGEYGSLEPQREMLKDVLERSLPEQTWLQGKYIVLDILGDELACVYGWLQ